MLAVSNSLEDQWGKISNVAGFSQFQVKMLKYLG